MPTLIQDLRFAFRQMRKSPGFALIAVLTLTLGIGATVIAFGVIDASLLHPLPIPNPRQVYTVQGKDSQQVNTAYPDYRDLRDRNDAFAELAIFRVARIGMNADSRGTAEPVWGYEASGNYFDMLGIQPAMGRFFRPSDDQIVGASAYAVLSYNAWQTRFSGDRNIAGRTVYLNKHPYTIVGVAPREFHGTERFIWPELWVPIHNEAQIEGFNWIDERGDKNAWMVGRLKPGVGLEQAETNLAIIAAQLSHDYPLTDKGIGFRLSHPGYFGDMLGGPVRGFMIGILLMALLVLLAVCVNLGALFAARTADRARELAIRIAIGSSRARLFRQLLTEAVCIAIIGGVGAMTAARAILHMLSLWHPPTDFPLQVLVEPGPLVFVVAAMVSLATGVIFGSIPARQIWKTDPNQAIKNAGATAAFGRRVTLRDLLLGIQIALCCLLVTASFVSLRGLLRAFTMPLGFQQQGVTLASFDVHLADYQASEVPAIQRRILDEASRIPGVISAAYSSTTPLSLDQSNTSIFPEGTTDFSANNTAFESPYYNVSPGYFSTSGTRLLRGRDFSPRDTEKSPTVAIVNQTFARRLFGTEQAVGRRCPGYAGRGVEVVGVVEDGKYHSLTESPSPAIFYSINQNPSTSTVLIVRSDLPPAVIIPALRQVIAHVDAGLPIFAVSSWQDALALMQFPARAATIALGVLGALAMCISVTGIFGLASYSVARRLRELGIRSALGAPSARILSAALGRTFVLLTAGSLAGLTLGLGTGHLLASIVYQATASDPLVLVGAALTMALVGFMSAALPARRALAVHPAVLLRDE